MTDEEETKPRAPTFMEILGAAPLEDVPKTRLVTLYGEIDEDKANALINNLYFLKETGVAHIPLEPTNPETDIRIEYEPVQLLISSEGGAVSDMFSIYDVMRHIKQECEIHTLAVGQAMSAGLPLVAAGTKGCRKAGKYCRFMFHGISGGNFGTMHDLKNDMKEVLAIQDRYVEILMEESTMTKRQVNRLLNKKIDVYFDAKQALAWGIIDEII